MKVFVRGMSLPGSNVKAVTTADYPAKAHRPAYSALDKTKIKREFGVEVPEWREALERMMDSFLKL